MSMNLKLSLFLTSFLSFAGSFGVPFCFGVLGNGSGSASGSEKT